MDDDGGLNRKTYPILVSITMALNFLCSTRHLLNAVHFIFQIKIILILFPPPSYSVIMNIMILQLRDWTCFRYVVSQTWKNKDFLSLRLFSLNTYQEDTRAHKSLRLAIHMFFVFSKKVLKFSTNYGEEGRIRKGKEG